MKKHWTQTPDGKERMRQIQQERHRPGGHPRRETRSVVNDRESLRAHDHPNIAVQRQIVLSLKGRDITLEEQDARTLNERLTALLKDH